MKNVFQFVSEVKLELSRVVWPKLDEWIRATLVVMALVFIFAVYLGLVDFCLSKLVQQIFKMYS